LKRRSPPSQRRAHKFIFVAGIGLAVRRGTFVPVPQPLTDDNYQSAIAAVLGAPTALASAIAAEYPLAADGSPVGALSVSLLDANFACPALQLDTVTSRYVPTFAYEFNDGNVPQRLAPPGLPPIVRRAEHTPLWDA
jgi:para-nitrobenzyl esterase